MAAAVAARCSDHNPTIDPILATVSILTLKASWRLHRKKMTEKMMTVDSIDHKKNKKIYVGCWIAERYTES